MPARVSTRPRPRPCAAGSIHTPSPPPSCVDPTFGRSLVDLRLGPATLLGMPGEGRIVDAKDLGIVFGSTIRPNRHTFGHNDFRKLRSIEWSTQLQEFTNADQIEALGEFDCGVDVSVRPDTRARPAL